jgi:hypothetical protein
MIGYTFYLSERTAELKAQFPSITPNEIEIIVSIEWKHLSNDDKTRIIELSNELENITTSLDEFLLSDECKKAEDCKELQISSLNEFDEDEEKSIEGSLNECQGCKYDKCSQLDHMNHPGACMGYF